MDKTGHVRSESIRVLVLTLGAASLAGVVTTVMEEVVPSLVESGLARATCMSLWGDDCADRGW